MCAHDGQTLNLLPFHAESPAILASIGFALPSRNLGPWSASSELWLCALVEARFAPPSSVGGIVALIYAVSAVICSHCS